MSSAYVAKLNRELEAERTEAHVAAAPDLRQRFIDWYEALPPVSRSRPFAMEEIERALGSQGRYISKILIGLGWERRRRWSDVGPYSRYWLPPSLARSVPSN